MKVKKKARERQPPLSIQVEIGRQAFYRGKLNNPFRPNTAFYREWERGFNQAYFENLEKINAN